jgi:putative Holliday junction resolvase
MTRILAVDPGDVRIGTAVSDPTRLIATPLTVIQHTSRAADAERILQIAQEHDAQTILVGIPYGLEEKPGPQARKAIRLADEIKSQAEIDVILWDESGSSRTAEALYPSYTLKDAAAAAVILQDYLDAQNP